MNKISILTTALVLVAGTSIAQPGWGHGDRDPAELQQRIFERLGLDESQQESWVELHERHREETRPLMEKAKGLHQELEELRAAENPNPTTLGELMLEARELHQEMNESRSALHEELASFLTEEQLKTFTAMRERMHGGPKGPRGHHGPGGPRGLGRPPRGPGAADDAS